MAKMWAGRFTKETDQGVNDFNSSISFDARMYRHDIAGSVAHATMLAHQGIISQEDADAIIKGLGSIREDIENGTLQFDPQAEDIHMFIEAELTSRIGNAGKRLHTARSRNDQVALDIRLMLRDEVDEIKALTVTLVKTLCDMALDAGKRLHTARSRNDQVALDIRLMLRDEVDEIKALTVTLVKTLCDMALENTETIMPGYTHLQRAQPITFAQHLMAYASMFIRDLGRLFDLKKRMNFCPLGSGALAGTTYPIDREMTASLLGFTAPVMNTLDGVSDRDFCIELASAISIIMMHLSRFAEEVILWCSWEFKFMELDDAFATGSSIMPQKKNPDVAELVRGKTGRVYGDLVTLLSMMKSLPLAYNKDMQEDKEAIFDAVDTVKLCLSTFEPMLRTATILGDNMRAAAAKGFINATDCADYLTKKGVPFRDAYKITGQLVGLCVQKGLTLETLPLSEYQALSPVFEEDVYQAIDLTASAFSRDCIGGPAKERVEDQIRWALFQLDQLD